MKIKNNFKENYNIFFLEEEKIIIIYKNDYLNLNYKGKKIVNIIKTSIFLTLHIEGIIPKVKNP